MCFQQQIPATSVHLVATHGMDTLPEVGIPTVVDPGEGARGIMANFPNKPIKFRNSSLTNLRP